MTHLCTDCGTETSWVAHRLCRRCYRNAYRRGDLGGAIRRNAASFRTRALVLPDDAPDTAWQDRAECLQYDPELFFPTLGQSTAVPRSVCQVCPVRVECLEYALATEWVGSRHGVWGGVSPKERARIYRERKALNVRITEPTTESRTA